MSIPTVAVTCVAHDQNGNPVAGGNFRFQLDRTEIHDGFVVPEMIEGVADSTGTLVVNLWPNALGVNGSSYRVQALNPDTGRKFLDAQAVIPNSACQLKDVVVLEPYPPVDVALQAVAGARAAETVAIAQAGIATTKANEAATSATAAAGSASAAAASATTAANQAAAATTQAGNAATSATASATSATAAANSATSAATSASTANTRANSAADSELAAAASQTAAATSATNAAASATASSSSATTATNQATNASTSATNASNSASAAADSATTAATQASNATTQAASAATSAAAASSSATAAAGSATTASTQAANAGDSASAAATSATNAASSATSASNSASTATTQATSASASATTATTQAGIATTQAGNAATSAGNASTSATNAASSASSAAASAASAAASLDNFDDRYLGPKSSDPTVDNDGNALLMGALYYRSTAPIGMKVYDGAQWIEASAAQQASLVTYEYNATAGQTTFSGADANGVTLSYTPGGIIVALNGSLLRPGDDFAASNGTSVVLVSAAALNDELKVIAFRTFEVANTYTQAQVNALLAASANSTWGLFRKLDPSVAAFTKTGNFTVTTATQLFVEVGGLVRVIAANTAVTMPSATIGTDYAIWCRPDGTLEATSNHTSPPVANSRKIGGFHYAPGGNATAQAGGNTTAQINEYSFWDLMWRPSCSDPRGMTLVAGGFWMDIYLTGVDAITNGSSKYNVVMADGSSPPKVPTMFGGNGSTTYGSYTWFEAMELATAFGKRCPTQQEFMSAMYGTTEASSVGTDQGSTILNAAYTSRWGVIQSTGVLYIWARDRGGPFAGAIWNANTEGRGSEYNAPNACLLGGAWTDGSPSGSRCSYWGFAASISGNTIGSRFSCDHLQLD